MTATRRTVLGGASTLAASVIVSGASFAAIAAPPGADTDAALLALREPWLASVRAFRAALDVLSAAETDARKHRRSDEENEDDAGFAIIDYDAAMTAAHDLEEETSDANRLIVHQVIDLPAHTLAGIRFKVEVSEDEDHMLPELVDSIMADIVVLAERTRGHTV